MAKRDIGKEIIHGLKEIKAWKKGETTLKTFTVDMRCADVITYLQPFDNTFVPNKTR